MAAPAGNSGQQTLPGASGMSPPGYWKRLVTYGESVKTNDPVLGEYAALQRVNLIHLQNELAGIKADLAQYRTTSETQMLRLRNTLHQYADAIRDFEYMRKLTIMSDSEQNDSRIFLEVAFPELGGRPSYPFDTTYRKLRREAPVLGRDVVRETLRKHLFRRLAWSPTDHAANKVAYNKGEPPKTYSPFVDRLARFIIAVGGGAALVVPMLIMSFASSKTKSLITTSVAVVLFALSLSLGFATDNKDTVTATATYAAVLVVFVGTSNPTS